MKYFVFAFIIVFLIKIQNSRAETDKCTMLVDQLIKVSSEANNEFVKNKNAADVTEKYGKIIETKSKELDKIAAKDPDCRYKSNAAKPTFEKNLSQISKALNAKSPGFIDYNEWYTIQKIGKPNNIKYSFPACIIGSRNGTAISCGSSGTAAKRIFYNSSQMKNEDQLKLWINTNYKESCVTAYLKNGEAYIYEIVDGLECEFNK